MVAETWIVPLVFNIIGLKEEDPAKLKLPPASVLAFGCNADGPREQNPDRCRCNSVLKELMLSTCAVQYSLLRACNSLLFGM